MIPDTVLRYLQQRGYSFNERAHETAYTAAGIAEQFQLPDTDVAETVLLRVDGKPWLALIPAGWELDFDSVASELNAETIEPLGENRADLLFMGTDAGAEAAFGGLYGIPVIMDEALTRSEAIIVRSGSVNASLEIRTVQYLDREQPNIASISVLEAPGIASKIGEVAGQGVDETLTPQP